MASPRINKIAGFPALIAGEADHVPLTKTPLGDGTVAEHDPITASDLFLLFN